MIASIGNQLALDVASFGDTIRQLEHSDAESADHGICVVHCTMDVAAAASINSSAKRAICGARLGNKEGHRSGVFCIANCSTMLRATACPRLTILQSIRTIFALGMR